MAQYFASAPGTECASCVFCAIGGRAAPILSVRVSITAANSYDELLPIQLFCRCLCHKARHYSRLTEEFAFRPDLSIVASGRVLRRPVQKARNYKR